MKNGSGLARAPKGTRQCAHCGIEFAWHRDRTKFCSRTCQHAGKTLPVGQVRHGPLVPRPCVECGDDLRGTGLRLRCGDCTQALRLAKRTRTCLVCGTAFLRGTSRGESKRVLCGSPICRAARARTLPSTRSRHRYRRALKAGYLGVERIDPLDVYERDGWRCALCHRIVNPLLPGSHLRGPTLDHIVALSEGGNHTMQNVQLAHRMCNMRKGARGMGQLRLIG